MPQEQKLSEKEINEKIVRIMQADIPGNKQVYVGLTKIKGVSFPFSNAICHSINLDKSKKIGSLNEEEIKQITEFIRNPQVPAFLLNRRKDLETGKDVHLSGTDLDLAKELDIKRLKKIRTYRGLRHATGQPTRGQRTKSHFRTKGSKKAIGVKRKK